MPPEAGPAPVRETPRPQPEVAAGPSGKAVIVDPAPEAAPPRNLAAILAELGSRLQDAFFAYDRFDLTNEALTALQQNARLLAPILSGFPSVKVTVEGHCDERGSAEYNLALGDRRARRAAEQLRDSGVPEASLHIVSYGREKPQCEEPSESCWQRNRRAHLVVREGRE
ncbi:MAG: OmpA family protein [Bryobacteraceae bacterium]